MASAVGRHRVLAFIAHHAHLILALFPLLNTPWLMPANGKAPAADAAKRAETTGAFASPVETRMMKPERGHLRFSPLPVVVFATTGGAGNHVALKRTTTIPTNQGQRKLTS